MDTHLNIGTNPLNGHAVRFGVMGSAGSDHDPEVVQRCRTLGRSVAQYGCCLLTGACPGLPQAAALGAKDENGHTIGISPAISFKEHVEIFHSPWQEYDVLIYTGLGFMGRELINIRSSDIVVLLGGRSGTLGEFAIAYDEGKLIGVLTGTGGVAVMREIENHIHKSTGSIVIYDEDPVRLIERLLVKFNDPNYACPCDPSPDELNKSKTCDYDDDCDPSCNLPKV